MAASWKAHLADYEVTPLFAQFDNAVPDLDRAATDSYDLQGHLTDTFSFRGVATKRGYQRGPAEDGAWFDEYTKRFGPAGTEHAEADLRARNAAHLVNRFIQ